MVCMNPYGVNSPIWGDLWSCFSVWGYYNNAIMNSLMHVLFCDVEVNLWGKFLEAGLARSKYNHSFSLARYCLISYHRNWIESFSTPASHVWIESFSTSAQLRPTQCFSKACILYKNLHFHLLLKIARPGGAGPVSLRGCDTLGLSGHWDQAVTIALVGLGGFSSRSGPAPLLWRWGDKFIEETEWGLEPRSTPSQSTAHTASRVSARGTSSGAEWMYKSTDNTALKLGLFFSI